MGLESIARGAFGEIDKARERRQFFDNPVLWCEKVLGIRLWSRQAEVAMAVVNNKNVVVKAGHEVGKSFLAGLLIAWWVDTRWDLEGGCFVVSTAPSTRQINAIVWREVRKAWQLHKKRHDSGLVEHPPAGYITSDAHWRLPNGIELGYGAKPPKQDEDSMSGIHARYVLSVGDEAVGLSESLIGDLANITSNATSRRLLICNPTNPLSYVASIFKRELQTWSRHTISVFDSPNFHGRGVCNAETCKDWEPHQKMEPREGLPQSALESLVDQSYVDGIIDEHGKDSPTYTSRVLGDFAWDMGFTLFQMEDIAEGLDADITPGTDSRPVIGADFSRSKAGDKNTVYSWHDGKLRFIDAWNESNAMRTADRVHQHMLETGAWALIGDGQGLGGPILDRISELSEGKYTVIGVDSNFRSPDIVKWANYRAYMYWRFKDLLSKGKIDLDVDDDKLQEQLVGIEIKKRLVGRDNILLESKEEMKKRGVSSPDHADAAVLASCDPYEILGLNEPPLGTVIAQDREEIPDYGLSEYLMRPGQPLLL